MFSMGFVVALGLLVMFARLPWRGKLWLTSHPLTVDIAVFIGLSALHWGTFSGLMVAAIGSLFCSITLSLAKRVIGSFDQHGNYTRGFLDVSQRIQ